MKPNKPQKKTDYKKKLDEIFSVYIRLKYANSNGFCKCISCGHMHHWTRIQNGHYMSRQYLSTRFDENNCRPQCVACNIFQHGNIQLYRRGLVKEIGAEMVDMVETKALSVTTKYYDWEYEQMFNHYKKEVERLKKEKGL